MKKFFDKFGAIWCILTSREYIVFSCNDFMNTKSGKCWVSYGIHEKIDNNKNVFLEASKDYIELLIKEKNK